MDEYEDNDSPESEETQEVATPQPTDQLPEWAQKELAKARKEAEKYRRELRRSQLQTEFGSEVMELVPATLPLTDQKALAEKLKARLSASPAPASSEQATTETPTEGSTVDATALAAVTTAGSGSPDGLKPFTWSEFDALRKKVGDAAAVTEAQRRGFIEAGPVAVLGGPSS